MEEKIEGALKGFYEKTGGNPNVTAPLPQTKTEQFLDQNSKKNVDPDLNVGYEVIKLPSKGIFYPNGVSEVMVEYMTSKDEDILSTPSLIENNTALDILLKNKVKSKDLFVDDMLAGDKNAIAIFLRATAYGTDYDVEVRDPRTGKFFKTKVDLTKLLHKEVNESPDANLEFTVELPVRKKLVKFKLLPEREIDKIVKNAKNMQEAYNLQYSPFGGLILKAHITQIGAERSKDYINRFIDAMPPRDSAKIKKKIIEVTPNIDLNYTFTASDGYQFTTPLEINIDFFFPLD